MNPIIKPDRAVQSKDVGNSSKPKKPRVKMGKIKAEVKSHLDKLSNGLRPQY